jgi:DNA invertase Pin-like site-specific DNA recombinase
MDTWDAIYPRVSSKGQKEASQLPDLERWERGQGGPFVRWYRDTFTGTSLHRPGWDELWADVLACKVKRVVIWRLDRLGRTASGLTALFDQLLARDVTLISLREGIDLKTPAGRLMAGVIASVAQYETEVRSERQIAGIEAAKERGVKFGRKPGTGKPISVTDEQRQQVWRMFHHDSEPVAGICRATGIKSRTTVYRILQEDRFQGAAP